MKIYKMDRKGIMNYFCGYKIDISYKVKGKTKKCLFCNMSVPTKNTGVLRIQKRKSYGDVPQKSLVKKYIVTYDEVISFIHAGKRLAIRLVFVEANSDKGETTWYWKNY